MPGVVVVNLNDIACPRGVCSAWVAGELAYRDAQHLNASYVLGLAAAVGERLAPYIETRSAAAAQ